MEERMPDDSATSTGNTPEEVLARELKERVRAYDQQLRSVVAEHPVAALAAAVAAGWLLGRMFRRT